jgi:restriction system protein
MQETLRPSFINREKEFLKLTELLFTKKSRLILIQGEPGLGKTAFTKIFLNDLNAEAFWLNLQQVTRITDFNASTQGGYFRLSLGDGVVTACQKARYVVVDEVNHFNLPDILGLVGRCPKQQFILLSLEALDLPAYADRIVLSSLSQTDIKQLVETWAILLGLDVTPQQMSDFLERYSGKEANPRRILKAIEAMREAGGFGVGLNALQPFTQSGLLDTSGQPLSSESRQFLEIVSNVKFVNSHLLNDSKRDPSILYKIDSREFELLVAELLSEQGFNVDVTRKSRDGGVDIWIAENRGIGSFKYLVECKRYSPDNKVGVKIVREVFGTVQASRATAGLIVTTSYFTKDAKEFAEQVRYQLSLRDYVDIRKWLGRPEDMKD